MGGFRFPIMTSEMVDTAVWVRLAKASRVMPARLIEEPKRSPKVCTTRDDRQVPSESILPLDNFAFLAN